MSRVWSAVLLVVAATAARAAPPDFGADRWVEIAPPARTGHACAYDSRHRRLIIFGGHVAGAPRNDVWVLSLSGQPRWDRIEVAGESPSPRSESAAAYDVVGDRLLLFGGRDTAGKPLDDLWELPLQRPMKWARIPSAVPHPMGRWQGTLTLDPQDGSFVLFGGEGRLKLGDVWRLSGQNLEWSPMTVEGIGPSPRSGHSAVYCPDLHGILVFGGAIAWGLQTAETWLLTLGERANWSRLMVRSSEGPCGMQGQVAAWDATDHRMLLFGGDNSLTACAVSYATVWALSVPGLAWTRLAPDPPWPRARWSAAAFFDAESRSLYVHGGALGGLERGASCADAWRLSLDPEPSWALLAPRQVAPRFNKFRGRPAVMDLKRDRIILDAGDGLWTYSLKRAEWRPLAVSGPTPPEHEDNIAVLDTRRDQLLIYGGRLPWPVARPFQQVWTLTLGDDPAWAQLATRGQARANGAAVYDPVGDRLVFYGQDCEYFGCFGEAAVSELPLGGSSPPEWHDLFTSLAPGSLPPTRLGFVAAHDSKRNRLVIFGGGYPSFDGTSPKNGCWALDLDGAHVWHQLSPSQSWFYRDPTLPSPRMDASAVYDAAGDRLVVVGGAISGLHLPDDAWTLDLGTNRWAQIRTESDPHPGWLNSSAVYDAYRHRILVLQDDVVWALEPRPPAEHRRAETALLESHSSRPDPLVVELRVVSNPSPSEITAQFTLVDAEPASLELLDVAAGSFGSRW